MGLREAYAGHGFRIEEFGLGTKPVGPAIVKVAEDDTVWVALALAKKIAHVANDGTLLREYPLFSNSFPVGVVEDHSGKVWYADAVRNAIASVEPDTGAVKEYPVPTPAAWPFFMILDSKGTIWFTERMGNKIGRFDPQTKQFEEYSLPTAHSQPAGMAVTYDDHVFFTENSNHKVGHLAPGAKAIEEYAVPSMLKKDPYYGLAGIFAAPNGDIWFAELDGRLGLVKRQGNQYLPVQEIPVPDPSGRPAGVFVDRSGRVWFTELDGNRIGRFDPKTKQFHKYLIPTGAPDRRPLAPPEKTARGDKAGKDGDKAKTSRPFGIFGDSKGNIWFSEQYGHQLGKLVLGGGALKSERPKQPADDKTITIRNNQCGRVTSPALRVVAGEQVAWRLGGAAAEGTRYTVSDVSGEFQLSCEGPNATDCQHRFWREGEYRYAVEGEKWSVEGQVLVGPRTVTMKEYELPRKDSVPGVLDLDEEGNVWFTEIGGFPLPGLGHIPPGNRIGRISSTGEISEFETPTPASAPTSLKVAKDGTVWFTEQRANNIAFLDPRRGVIEEIPLPTPNSSPVGIAVNEERGWDMVHRKGGQQDWLFGSGNPEYQRVPNPHA